MDLPARHSSVAARIALSAAVNRSELRQSRTARMSSGGSPAAVATRQWFVHSYAEPVTQPIRMIMSSRSRVSNLLFSNSCINWLKATLATPGLLATTRNASLCVRRAGMPIASPSSRARSSETIGTREVIVTLPLSAVLGITNCRI